MWKLFSTKKKKKFDIFPDEIFMDSSNLPDFDMNQLEGRLEKSIPKGNIFFLGAFFLIVGVFFFGRLGYLQINQGQAYADRSANNHLKDNIIFADRGLITDRNDNSLAWNSPGESIDDYSLRAYTTTPGFGNLLGYVKYPAKDNNGYYYKFDVTGNDGIEQYYNDQLSGKNGLNIIETNAAGKVESQASIRPPEQGTKIMLSIDQDVQRILFENIKKTVDTSGFIGGGAVIMDIHTGEVLGLTTYPEYNSEIMTNGTNTEAITGYATDPRNPFLDRTVAGFYAPGSIIKPYIALGALNEKVITPEKKLESTGSISIPNPYVPGQFTIFKDWRVNGWTDVREAIAVSSDVYFYEIGGGFKDQKGMGIDLIDKYVSLFGFGKSMTGSFFSTKNPGVVPTQDWKKEMFNGEPWRLGDTYHTAIGQFGFQVTPIQAVRAVAAMANGGTVITPSIIKAGEAGYVAPQKQTINNVDPQDFQIVREGMRLAVTDGTLGALKTNVVSIAGKTGTAEVGNNKDYVNSWVTGFFPYENPKYAFALVLEKGPTAYAEGAPAAMRRIIEEMSTTTQQYFQ